MRGVNIRPNVAVRAGATVVKHREYIADIAGQSAFTVLPFAVNPGQAATFPWLSTIAKNYDKYRFSALKFIFESTVATTTPGVTMGAFDMDASDVPPTTKAVMMQYQGATRANVWLSHSSVVPRKCPDLFVRPTSQPAGTDIKTYDVANFYLAVSGTSTGNVGELYVEYTVELFVPQTNSSSSAQSLSLAATGSWDATTGVQGGLSYTIQQDGVNTAAVYWDGTQSDYYLLTARYDGTVYPRFGYPPANLGTVVSVVNYSGTGFSIQAVVWQPAKRTTYQPGTYYPGWAGVQILNYSAATGGTLVAYAGTRTLTITPCGFMSFTPTVGTTALQNLENQVAALSLEVQRLGPSGGGELPQPVGVSLMSASPAAEGGRTASSRDFATRWVSVEGYDEVDSQPDGPYAQRQFDHDGCSTEEQHSRRLARKFRTSQSTSFPDQEEFCGSD
jgi:hypothetical protein